MLSAQLIPRDTITNSGSLLGRAFGSGLPVVSLA